jgi:protein involved in polysaccharide export with SLBB domain
MPTVIPMDKIRTGKRPAKTMQLSFRIAGGLFSLCSLLIVIALIAGPLAFAADTEEPNVTVSSTYTLAPYDVIDISVYGEDDLHTRAKLGADGTAVLPLIGAIALEGKTIAEATDLITKRYADGFVKDPHLQVSVVEYRKTTFAILGQVFRPGIYEIPEGAHMTVVDAVLVAGGFTRVANQNGVTIKRLVKGQPTIIKVKAGSMADSAKVAPYEIKPGDIIKVPESWW